MPKPARPLLRLRLHLHLHLHLHLDVDGQAGQAGPAGRYAAKPRPRYADTLADRAGRVA